jgi:hypothetical protein
MDAKQVDDCLLSVLNELPYFSNIGTFLLIRLADHAAQLNGFRSTRQVDENSWKYVDDKYNELVDRLKYNIYEATNYLKDSHTYKDSILDLADNDLRDLLEETLFDMTIFETHAIFHENFFKE